MTGYYLTQFFILLFNINLIIFNKNISILIIIITNINDL